MRSAILLILLIVICLVAMPGDKRRDLMFKLAALLEAKCMDFVPSLVAENGSISMAAPKPCTSSTSKWASRGRARSASATMPAA